MDESRAHRKQNCRSRQRYFVSNYDEGPNRTQEIMSIFGDLGHHFNYRVSCHRSNYAQADDPEWLYDLVWYTYANKNIFGTMPMVLESELNRLTKDADEVDSDFHKLAKLGLV